MGDPVLPAARLEGRAAGVPGDLPFADPARHAVRAAGRADRRELPDAPALQRGGDRLSARVGIRRWPGAAAGRVAGAHLQQHHANRRVHHSRRGRDGDRHGAAARARAGRGRARPRGGGRTGDPDGRARLSRAARTASPGASACARAPVTVTTYRVGLVVPTSNTTMEAELPEILRARELGPSSERFTFHSARVRMRNVTAGELRRMNEQVPRAAAELADARPHAVATACLVAIMAQGAGYHRTAEKEIEAALAREGASAPVVSS